MLLSAMSRCATYILQPRCISLRQLWLSNVSNRQIVSVRLLNLHANYVPIAVSSNNSINSPPHPLFSKLNLSTLNTDNSRKKGIAQSDHGQRSRNDAGSVDAENDSSVPESLVEEKTGILKRFREAYKQYGKILVCVHVVTSAMWIGGFYYAAVR